MAPFVSFKNPLVAKVAPFASFKNPKVLDKPTRGEKASDFDLESKSVRYFLQNYLLSRTKSCIFKNELVNTNIKVE